MCHNEDPGQLKRKKYVYTDVFLQDKAQRLGSSLSSASFLSKFLHPAHAELFSSFLKTASFISVPWHILLLWLTTFVPNLSSCKDFSMEKEMADHSSILAWKVPWTEEPGGLQSTGSQKNQTHQQQNNNAFKWYFSPYPILQNLYGQLYLLFFFLIIHSCYPC